MMSAESYRERPPTIDGYFFSDDYVLSIINHNNRAYHASEAGVPSPRIGAVFLAIPARCNLRCPYCYTDASISASDEGLSDAEIEEVICSSAGLGARSVVVAGEGEPFASSSIWHIMECAGRFQMTCVVFTNGSLISPDIARELFTNQVSVILKVNSFRSSIQDRLVGVKGAHKAIYAGFDALLAAGFRAPRLGIQSAIMKPNIADLREVFLFCRMHSIVPYIETYVALGRGTRDDVRRALEPDVAEVTRFFAEIRRIDEERFGLQWPVGEKVRVVGYGPCNKNQVAVSVRLNGDVCRCITESKRLGSIRGSSLKEVLCSRRAVGSLVETRCTGCASQCFSCQVDNGQTREQGQCRDSASHC